MNACLQCLVPITELRDYYILQKYYDVANGGGTTRTRNNFDFSNRIHDLLTTMWSKSSRRREVVRPTLKTTLRRRFDPILQHDSHEFMVYLLEQL